MISNRFVPIPLTSAFFGLALGIWFASADTPYAHGESSASAMANTAKKFISTLNAEKLEKVVFEFTDRKQTAWHFFPNIGDMRAGLPLNALNNDQRDLVKQLLNALLTVEGFEEQENVRLIHGLKKNLAAEDNPRHLYYLAIFGTPSTKKTWGWRFEGHHLSLNCTLVNGQEFSITPSFWGSGPVTISKGPHAGIEVFTKERGLALELIHSLSAAQKKRATIDKKKGPGTKSTLARNQYPAGVGIPFNELNQSQQDLLLKLVRAFAQKYRPDILQQIDSRKKIEDSATMTFCFSNETEKYARHYRIQTKHYLIEFDNPDDNHVHSAWRDFDGDFGRDLIQEHIKNEH